MKNILLYRKLLFFLAITLFVMTSCEDFFDPGQDVVVKEEVLFDDWYEYRATAMGMYGLQRNLAEQLFVLGELRGDLVNITDNAEADLVEIYNFNPSRDNKYASPVNFFKLISATNNLILKISENHPEVTDPESPVTNYDRLYGEALCMRAWAYFNAVRIYGKVPYIPESLTDIEETQAFLNSPEEYTDSVHIIFGVDGYNNDTILNESITLEKKFYDQNLVIDHFTNELETKVKAVGVDYALNNNDNTWEVTTWNTHAMNALLGIMFLTDGNLAEAAHYFEEIVYLQSNNRRYQLDDRFSFGNWNDIFSLIDTREHIFTLWFNKSNLQQHNFQKLFEPVNPHNYMLKPSKQAVMNWETIWDDFLVDGNDQQPWKAKTATRGRPGDFFRGYNSSYTFMRNSEVIPDSSIQQMLILKAEGNNRSANTIIAGADTVIWKYSIGKGTYSEDANFIIYRAAGIHLWLAEVYAFWKFERPSGVTTYLSNAVNIVNDGSNYGASGSRRQLGVRGRVGFADETSLYNDKLVLRNVVYERDPVTNEVTGYRDFTINPFQQQLYLEEKILDERARELAFEGERFYDLMRMAKRRNDPSFLAEKVSAKFPSGERDRVYNLLMDETNWYINYFD
ncbi:MAG TPA: RagB/SusD family nutrient uptake outer membrane protein [Bacteroidales bacterium]|nr:RagB/SusD family nutrient uptake outer membrane protein [Bacteroidales bacterium]